MSVICASIKMLIIMMWNSSEKWNKKKSRSIYRAQGIWNWFNVKLDHIERDIHVLHTKFHWFQSILHTYICGVFYICPFQTKSNDMIWLSFYCIAHVSLSSLVFIVIAHKLFTFALITTFCWASKLLLTSWNCKRSARKTERRRRWKNLKSTKFPFNTKWFCSEDMPLNKSPQMVNFWWNKTVFQFLWRKKSVKCSIFFLLRCHFYVNLFFFLSLLHQ